MKKQKVKVGIEHFKINACYMKTDIADQHNYQN